MKIQGHLVGGALKKKKKKKSTFLGVCFLFLFFFFLFFYNSFKREWKEKSLSSDSKIFQAPHYFEEDELTSSCFTTQMKNKSKLANSYSISSSLLGWPKDQLFKILFWLRKIFLFFLFFCFFISRNKNNSYFLTERVLY